MKKVATEALDDQYLRPLMIQSSPSRTARVVNTRGSDPPWGSVIEKVEKISPDSKPGQVLVLLFLGAEPGDDLGIAGVGGLGAEDDRRPGCPAEDLVDQGELHRAESLTTEVGSQMRRPQALVAHLLLERVDDAAPFVVQRQEFAAGEEHFEGFDLLADELPDPLEFLLELRFDGKVECHVSTP